MGQIAARIDSLLHILHLPISIPSLLTEQSRRAVLAHAFTVGRPHHRLPHTMQRCVFQHVKPSNTTRYAIIAAFAKKHILLKQSLTVTSVSGDLLT